MDSKQWASLKGTDKLKSILRSCGLSLALSQVSWQSLSKTEKKKIESHTKGSGWHEKAEEVVTREGIKKVAPRHREVAIKESLKDCERTAMSAPIQEIKKEIPNPSELYKKIADGTATESERQEYKNIHLSKTDDKLRSVIIKEAEKSAEIWDRSKKITEHMGTEIDREILEHTKQTAPKQHTPIEPLERTMDIDKVKIFISSLNHMSLDELKQQEASVRRWGEKIPAMKQELDAVYQEALDNKRPTPKTHNNITADGGRDQVMAHAKEVAKEWFVSQINLPHESFYLWHKHGDFTYALSELPPYL